MVSNVLMVKSPATRFQNVLHYPRLDTVMMVEDAIRNTRSEFTKTKLWNSLPKKVQYQTFQLILSYLEQSNKITYTATKKIVWIATNPKLDRITAKGVEY